MLVKAVTGPKLKYTQAEVRDYLHHHNNIKWVKAGDLLDKLNDACVDGREREPIVASPGGDTALLAEAIIAISKFSGKHLNPVEINQVFRWRLKTLGSFYMHTDEHGLNNLIKSLQLDDRFKRLSFKTVGAVFEYLKQPDTGDQVSLLDHLLVPENCGCGHLKLMLSKPEAYGMSRKVLQGIIKAFFDTLWNGSALEKKLINYKYLTGDHKEGAVVTIVTAEKVNRESLIPAVRPSDGKLSMFIFHPQAAAFIHHEQAIALAASGLFKEINLQAVDNFVGEMGGVLGEGVRETISHLAWGLPQYTFELKK